MSQAANNSAIAEGRYGNIEFSPSDGAIGAAMLKYREWRQAELEVLRAFIGLGSTVVEIGAGVGAHTTALSMFVGPSGRVIAYEPRIEAFGLLQRNVARSGRENISLHKPHGESLAGGLASIDGLGLEACHLVKLSLDGVKAGGLAGMTTTLARHRPVLFIPCEDGELPALGPARYRFFLVATAAYNPANAAGNPDNVFGSARDANLLCVPEELAPLVPTSNATTQVTPVGDGETLAAALRAGRELGSREQAADRRSMRSDDAEQDGPPVQALLAEIRGMLSEHIAEFERERSARQRAAREVDDAQAAVTRAEFRAKSLARQLEQADRQAAIATAATAAERDRLVAALDEVAARDRAIAALSADLAGLRGSTSWRLTKPLRWLKGGRT